MSGKELDIDELERRVCKSAVVDAEALTTLTKALKDAGRTADADTIKLRLQLVHALRRVFSSLIRRGDLEAKRGEENDALSQYFHWVKGHYLEFLHALHKWVSSSDIPRLQVAAARTFLHLYQPPCDAVSSTEVLEKLLLALLCSSSVNPVTFLRKLCFEECNV